MKIDALGWEYHDILPAGYRPAKLSDFLIGGKRRIGMEFLIKRAESQRYDVHKVSERLTSAFLIPFINDKRVFIHE